MTVTIIIPVRLARRFVWDEQDTISLFARPTTGEQGRASGVQLIDAA